jgi:hypothetical protein
MRTLLRITLYGLFLLGLTACQNPADQKLILSTKSPVELRAMQSRAFDITDRNKALRTVIATLQDLGYTIDKVEPAAGSISATKLANLRLSATVYPRGQTQMIVRANAIYRLPNQDGQVDDPEFYQKYFFEPLSKAFFLNALQVEDPPDPADAINPEKKAALSQWNFKEKS